MAWVYSQRRHTIRHVIDGNVEFSDHTGYSGNGNSRDDPRAEHKKNHGPIPRGHWTIGLIERSIMITTTEGNRKHLKDAMRLTYNNGPAPYGRDHFLIHGDNSRLNHTASDGCIILGPDTRHRIAASGDRNLVVEF